MGNNLQAWLTNYYQSNPPQISVGYLLGGNWALSQNGTFLQALTDAVIIEMQESGKTIQRAIPYTAICWISPGNL
jgi:hypothetical protein